MGLRLSGPRLRCAAPELLSHAVQPGLVQLPPGGQPIVLAAGCAATGGYPRIGQIAAAELWKLAHLPPGSALRFAPIDLDSARERLRDQQQALQQLRRSLGAH
jgi:allophanate hydrolase subunit 2